MIKYEDMGRIDRDWWRYDANKAGGLGSSIYNAKQNVYSHVILSISLHSLFSIISKMVSNDASKSVSKTVSNMASKTASKAVSKTTSNKVRKQRAKW